jgi:hypothetical protein
VIWTVFDEVDGKLCFQAPVRSLGMAFYARCQKQSRLLSISRFSVQFCLSMTIMDERTDAVTQKSGFGIETVARTNP